MKVLNRLVIVLTFLTTSVLVSAQSKVNEKEQKVRQLINGKKYMFVAQTALPMTGRSINLTSTFDLSVSEDTIISELPYFGRAYVAPINPTEGGIRFKSIGGKYKVKEKNNGGWEIVIEPKDVDDVREMYLSVTESGYANLRVVNTNRQGISFNGYITTRY